MEAGLPAGDDRIGVCLLTKQARRQISELEPDERRLVVGVLERVEDAEHVSQIGYRVGSSPAGDVWRIRMGRVGIFLAVEDEVLVVGFAARRGGGMGWYDS